MSEFGRQGGTGPATGAWCCAAVADPPVPVHMGHRQQGAAHGPSAAAEGGGCPAPPSGSQVRCARLCGGAEAAGAGEVHGSQPALRHLQRPCRGSQGVRIRRTRAGRTHRPFAAKLHVQPCGVEVPRLAPHSHHPKPRQLLLARLPAPAPRTHVRQRMPREWPRPAHNAYMHSPQA